jgi:hypothetical protein
MFDLPITGLFFGVILFVPTGIIAAIYLTVRLNSRR